MKTAILTDSAALLPTRVSADANLKILELPFSLAEQTFYPSQIKDLAKITSLQEKKTGTLTEEPIALSEITSMMIELETAGYTDALFIHLASSISGLGANLRQFVKNSATNIKLHLVDSQSFGPAEGQLVATAVDLLTAGTEITQIIQAVTDERKHLHTLLITANLKNLRRTGSIAKNSRRVENSLLRHRCVLHFSKDGDLEILDNSTRTKKITQKLSIHLRYLPQQAMTILADDPQLLDNYQSELQAKVPTAQITAALFSPTIFSFTGPQTVLISWKD